MTLGAFVVRVVDVGFCCPFLGWLIRWEALSRGEGTGKETHPATAIPNLDGDGASYTASRLGMGQLRVVAAYPLNLPPPRGDPVPAPRPKS